MALWDDLMAGVGGSWLGTAAVGVGVVLVAPLVLPVVGAGLRPLTKGVLKTGLLLVGAVDTAVQAAGATVRELVAEVQADLHPPEDGGLDPEPETPTEPLVDAYGRRVETVDGA